MILVVDNQRIYNYEHQDPPPIATDSIQFIDIEFRLSEEWDGFVCAAQFVQGSYIVTKSLYKNHTTMPEGLVPGVIEISLFGYKAGEAVRGTTIPYVQQIVKSGLTSTEETPIPPTPDLYSQLLESIQTAEKATRGYSEQALSAVGEVKNYSQIAQSSSESAKTAANSAEAAALKATTAVEGFEDTVEVGINAVVQQQEDSIAAIKTQEQQSIEAITAAAERDDSAEQARVKAEQLRVEAENLRKQNEQTRIENELNRVEAERVREEAETERKNAEASRTQAEGQRNTAEVNRNTAEQTRVTQEDQRVTAENERQAAEQARKETFEGFEAQIEACTPDDGSIGGRPWSSNKINEELEKFAPISAAIRPTVDGNPTVCENSVAWGFQGLKIYGKSTQDGTPSPESPVPVVSAGEGGSIQLNITDGAEQNQSLILSTPSGLPGIPVNSGGNYTDANGQQWVCDVVDLIAMKLIKNVCEMHVVDHIDTIAKSSNQKGDTYFFTVTDFNLSIPTSSNNRYDEMICTHFVPGSSYSIDVRFDIANIDPISGSQNIRFCFGPTGSMPTLEDAREWFLARDVIVIYPLATPIITQLTDEEISAYRALTTYDGTTVVSTAEPVSGIQARYVADGTKCVESIESRLAALEAAMIGGIA